MRSCIQGSRVPAIPAAGVITTLQSVLRCLVPGTVATVVRQWWATASRERLSYTKDLVKMTKNISMNEEFLQNTEKLFYREFREKRNGHSFSTFPLLFILSLGPSYNNCQSRKTLDFITSQLLPDIGKGGKERQR